MHYNGQLQTERSELSTLIRSKILTAEENQANAAGGNQQNIGSRANISDVVVQKVGGNAQVGGKGAQFGGKHETCKF